MNSLDQLLSNLTLSGACVTREPAASLSAIASSKGYGVYRLVLADIADKAALMKRFQDALGFPDWFGHNWDALEDSLTDMSWHDVVGYVLLIDGGADLRRSAKPLFDTLVDVLRATADYWRGAERPFWAFFINVSPDASLPSFP
jgi:RNAse (barnase) inhibitor barstar